MTEVARLDILGHLALWLLLVGLALFLRILPIDLSPGGHPGPDVILVLTMAWVLRRPAHLPALAIALVWLVEDLMMLRPPGLWALLVLVGTEFLRARHSVVREITFMLEWAMVTGVLLAMTLAYRLVIAIVMLPQDPLDLSLMKLGLTVASYPAVVLVLHFVLRIRKPATGEVDELGRKL
ncbi:rod shape-determining protein MreD [Pararhodobacter sp. SW119]|uniref:rod shape-determining protein MreD n=1 Tax=Pararhodobacter sp. SW119 TaxID=2780075 RepID=UPI001AE088F2|nr:rod shape-determining protein MreD [Pararhodobacter sp. SW119]